MERSKVIVWANFVVGYWELIPIESIKTHDQIFSHNTKILIIVVLIFYPRTQNNKYIELSKFETETILSKDKSCDFRLNQNPHLKHFSPQNCFGLYCNHILFYVQNNYKHRIESNCKNINILVRGKHWKIRHLSIWLP